LGVWAILVFGYDELICLNINVYVLLGSKIFSFGEVSKNVITGSENGMFFQVVKTFYTSNNE
jgi:hypothetical protein